MAPFFSNSFSISFCQWIGFPQEKLFVWNDEAQYHTCTTMTTCNFPAEKWFFSLENKRTLNVHTCTSPIARSHPIQSTMNNKIAHEYNFPFDYFLFKWRMNRRAANSGRNIRTNTLDAHRSFIKWLSGYLLN